jgi:hypothetical protein
MTLTDMSSRSPRERSLMLWGGLFLTMFAGQAMAVSRFFHVIHGPAEAAVLSVIGLLGLLGIVAVISALRHGADWTSNRETARLLEWLGTHEEEMRRAEACATAGDLRRSVEHHITAADVEALFGGGGDVSCARPGCWAERVRWDELFDALPRRGPRTLREIAG